MIKETSELPHRRANSERVKYYYYYYYNIMVVMEVSLFTLDKKSSLKTIASRSIYLQN